MSSRQPTILYHITPRQNVEKIKSEGLRTDATPGFDAGYVWGFDDLAMAEEKSTFAWGGGRGNNAIFALDVAGYDVIPDPHFGWADLRVDLRAFAVAHSIPAERVWVVKP